MAKLPPAMSNNQTFSPALNDHLTTVLKMTDYRGEIHQHLKSTS